MLEFVEKLVRVVKVKSLALTPFIPRRESMLSVYNLFNSSGEWIAFRIGKTFSILRQNGLGGFLGVMTMP